MKDAGVTPTVTGIERMFDVHHWDKHAKVFAVNGNLPLQP